MSKNRVKQHILDITAHDPPPATGRQLNGKSVDTSGDQWVLDDRGTSRVIDFSPLIGICTPEFLNGTKRVWFHRIASLSVITAVIDFNNYKRYIVSLYQAGKRPVDGITKANILNLRGNNPRKYTNMKTTLRDYIKKGFHGVDPEVLEVLDSKLRLGRDGVGLLSVRTLDPQTGPMLEVEEQFFSDALYDGYAKGSISLMEYCLGRFVHAYGVRPVQIRDLRLKHLEVEQDALGTKICWIHIPWGKQKETKEPRRYPLGKTLAEALYILAETVRTRFPKDELPGDMEWDDLPFFPAPGEGKPIPITTQVVKERIKALSKKLDLTTPRPGTDNDLMNITPRRLRYTVGTRLAVKEGASARAISDYLMQESPDSCVPYVGVAENLLEPFNKVFGPELNRYANIALNIVDKENEEGKVGKTITFSEDGHARPGLGKCRKQDCLRRAPIACYDCSDFRPWLDGSHEQVKSYVLKLRETEVTFDPTAATAFDKTLLMIELTIRKCAEIMSQRDQ